jgi:hypothetical protein
LPDPRRLAIYVGSYVVVIGVLYAAFWLMETRERDLGAVLSTSGVVTTASVTRSTPENHNTICFDYVVSGATYSGCDLAHFDKLASELPPGSTTMVTYDATNPSIYCACRAESLVRNAREAPVVGAFWIGSFLWFAVFLQVRSRAKKIQSKR